MISAINEDSFLIKLSDHIDLSLTTQISALVSQIEIDFSDALLDITPSYNTILVQINLLKMSSLVAEQLLITIVDNTKKVDHLQGKLIELPVYYDTSVGWDLKKVATEKKLSIAQVIQLHSATCYQVCAVGFAPGFAFLAELNEKIKQPRHVNPRVFVPAGSVAIADRQTAVYPSDSPGGWHIIGNCPVPLFALDKSPISPFKIGDRVKFIPITYLQFIDLGGKVIDEQ